ncbi:MAG: hypothetical protein EPN45_03720 [Rhizobiaceae bacterium]|nr:MAG: hypothetical protein EPN45_03720 [Rhizobiaceae bacterium]
MTDLLEDEELPQLTLLQRWRSTARAAITYGPSIISIGCAVAAGYFTYRAANVKPPANTMALAVSILKSPDTSPEMRAWATDALGIQTDLPVTTGSIKSP